MASPAHNYTEDSIKSLDWRQHIRLRPGMYIGKLGDGSQPEDGIYVLLKEVVDNCIDEHVMGFGKLVEIEITEENLCTIRDYGRGVPLGKLLECSAQINTGAKYDSEVFQRSVGLNGVGIKAVNALSEFFEIQAVREKQTRAIEFCRGEVRYDMPRPKPSEEADGTRISFRPDPESFSTKVKFNLEFVREMLRYYAWLNPGLTLKLNGEVFKSKEGLRDLIAAKLTESPQYPVIHLDGTDVEIAFTHGTGYGEEFYTFVNGQHTTQGGTHLAAFREAVVQECREFFKKQFEPSDVRTGIIAAVSVKVQEPVFESQTKTKLGSTHMEPNGRNLRTHIINTVVKELDNYQKRYKIRYWRMKRSAKRSAAFRKPHVKTPARPRSITRSCVTAASTWTLRTSAVKRAPFSSPKATARLAASPRAGMSKLRPSSACVASLSTALA
jgi:topoisomerase IV subunit B